MQPVQPSNTQPQPSAAPFLRWVGGKRKLAATLLEHITVPKGCRYHEPFLGGGAVFFALYNRGDLGTYKQEPHLADSNEELVITWNEVQRNLKAVLETLDAWARLCLEDNDGCERTYYHARSLVPATLEPPVRAARFILLNRLCFNGIYRVNSKGAFNVPLGKFAKPHTIESLVGAAALYAASTALNKAGARIMHRPFQAVLEDARVGDVVYFDPPYAPLSATSDFVAYTKDGFDGNAQIALRNVAFTLRARGVRVFISNSDVPLINGLYADRSLWNVHRLMASRAVNSDTAKRGKIAELFIASTHPDT